MLKFKAITRYLLGLFFIAAGANHFIHPIYYLLSMPPYLPWPEQLIYISGFFEILLGAMVLIKKIAPLAAWGLIALLIAVFPANVHMAANSQSFPDISPVALWLRLPLQFVLILWVYWYAKPEKNR